MPFVMSLDTCIKGVCNTLLRQPQRFFFFGGGGSQQRAKESVSGGMLSCSLVERKNYLRK